MIRILWKIFLFTRSIPAILLFPTFVVIFFIVPFVWSQSVDYILFLAYLKELPLNLTVREITHMYDVRIIFTFLYILFFVSYFLTFYNSGSLNLIKKSIISACYFVISICVGIMLSSLFYFEEIFLAFHQLVFWNDLWILPADSILITTFPSSFFHSVSLSIFITTLCFCGLIYFFTTKLFTLKNGV